MTAPQRQELFSQRAIAGSRTYFFDVKASSDGTKYLVISESVPTGETREHHRVMVFEEHLAEFWKAFKQAIDFLGVREPAYSVAEIRKDHAKAYQPWSAEEDQRLRERFGGGADMASLANEFQRRESAIRSRLLKLGLGPGIAPAPSAPVSPAEAADQELAKVLALKAYLLVRQSAASALPELRAQAERAVAALEDQQSPDGLRRRVFYNLVLAELTRDADPIPYRVAATDDGERLTALGIADPTPIYMSIVDAMTERRTTVHFGDFVSASTWSHAASANSPLTQSQALHGSIMPALVAADIDQDTVERHDRFLFMATIDEIMRKHGVA